MHIKYYRLEATKCFYHLNTYKTTIKLSLQYVLQQQLQVTSEEHIPCVWLVRERKANSSPLATSHPPKEVGLDLQWTLNTVL